MANENCNCCPISPETVDEITNNISILATKIDAIQNALSKMEEQVYDNVKELARREHEVTQLSVIKSELKETNDKLNDLIKIKNIGFGVWLVIVIVISGVVNYFTDFG